MNIQIDAPDAVVDQIVVAGLVETLETVEAEIKQIKTSRKAIGDLPDHWKEDLRSAKRFRKAARVILAYYGHDV